MTTIEQLENTMIDLLKESRRWKRDGSGQLMRKHKGEYHPVTWRDEQEVREILNQILDKTDRLLVVFFGEESRRRRGVN